MSDNLIKSYLYVFLICGLLTVGSNGQTTGPRPSCDETWQETRRRLLSVVSRFRFEIKASYQANVSHAAVVNLPSEKGTKTLNLIEHPGEGNIEAVKQHIAAGTDVDAKAGSIVTPLHVATVFGNKGIPELLIAKGVDVNAKMEDGRTPLNLAESKEHKEPADLLCKHGGKTGVELKAQGK